MFRRYQHTSRRRHGQRAFVVFIGLLLAALATFSWGAEPVYILRYERSTAGDSPMVSTVFFVLAPNMTRLQAPDGVTLFIDYKHLVVYRYNGQQQRCHHYPLRDPADPPLPQPPREGDVPAHLARIFGQVEVVHKQEVNEINGLPCRRSQVVFGPDVMFSRTVVPPTIRHYGRTFQPRTAEIWASPTVAEFDALLALGQRREAVFKANPLLRQLDPLGLVVPLQGVVVQAGDGSVQDTLQKVSRQAADDSIVVPQACLRSSADAQR